MSRLWAVVLAGGEGSRVEALTRGPGNEPVPKQYCAFGRSEPAVSWAVRRAAGIVPRSRVLVVVGEQHRRHWREALADYPRENIVVQPRNRGTAPGILLPVLEILLRRDRDALVLVLPADHHVESEDVLWRALRAAERAVRPPAERLVLLGMPGDDGDEECGWIVPSSGPQDGARAVLSFVEKPDAETSRQLADVGALVNSFIFASSGRALVRLYEEALPGLLMAFVPVVLAGRRDADVRALYEAIPSSDFSRTVLERQPGSLGVLPVPACGWTDLGTRSRLERFLGRSGLERAVLQPDAEARALAAFPG